MKAKIINCILIFVALLTTAYFVLNDGTLLITLLPLVLCAIIQFVQLFCNKTQREVNAITYHNTLTATTTLSVLLATFLCGCKVAKYLDGFDAVAIVVTSVVVVAVVTAVITCKVTEKHGSRVALLLLGNVVLTASCFVPVTNYVLFVVNCVLTALSVGFVAGIVLSYEKYLHIFANTYCYNANTNKGFVIATTVFAVIATTAVATNLQIVAVIMQIIVCLLVVTSVVTATKQPLDRRYSNKLLNITTDTEKQQIQAKLTDGKKSVLFAVLKHCLRPFVPCKTKNIENVPTDCNVVFVANHYEIFGPLSVIMHFPVFARPWVNYELTIIDCTKAQIADGFNKVFAWLSPNLRTKLLDVISPVLTSVVCNTEPIPVYREGNRNVIETMRKALEALDSNDNLLVFPENPDRQVGFRSDGVDEFQTGFVDVARMYYHKTGKITAFVPLYVDKRRHAIHVGNALYYNPSAPRQEEKTRIANQLHEQMTDLATKYPQK